MQVIVDAAKLQQSLEEWLTTKPLPLKNTVIEWKEYDPITQQVFIFVVGDWNSEIEKKVRDFCRQWNRRILISTVYYA